MSRGTQEPLGAGSRFRLQGCHLLWPAFPGRSTNAHRAPFSQTAPVAADGRCLAIAVLQPQALLADRLVWAVPISLATTLGITVVFFSTGY